METRIKRSKGLLWVTGVIFLGMVILAIFVHGGWSLAVFFGILLVVGLILYYLDKDNDLVIDDRGIHQVKGVDYKWYQINHCYCESRLKGSYGPNNGLYRSPYLIISQIIQLKSSPALGTQKRPLVAVFFGAQRALPPPRLAKCQSPIPILFAGACKGPVAGPIQAKTPHKCPYRSRPWTCTSTFLILVRESRHSDYWQFL